MSISIAEFDFVRGMVREQAAIVLDPGKEYLVESRLSPLAVREGFDTLARFLETLRKAPRSSLAKKVIDAMTTNETSFFRDVDPFEVLRATILPELLRARAGVKRLHIWSAACSTGQEPYTTAMILGDSFPMLADWDVRILATDISHEVLERARKAEFGQLEINRGLPAAFLLKYFDRQGTNWRVKESLRKWVRFQELNLIQPWPLIGVMDIVFVRNVLIYFDVATKKKVLSNVISVLRPDGYVFLGGAETPLNIEERLEPLAARRGNCYRLRACQ